MSRHSHCFSTQSHDVQLYFPAPTLFAVLSLVELCAAVILLGIIFALLDLKLVKEIHAKIVQAQLLQVVHHICLDAQVAGFHWQSLLEQLEGIVIEHFDSVCQQGRALPGCATLCFKPSQLPSSLSGTSRAHPRHLCLPSYPSFVHSSLQDVPLESSWI